MKRGILAYAWNPIRSIRLISSNVLRYTLQTKVSKISLTSHKHINEIILYFPQIALSIYFRQDSKSFVSFMGVRNVTIDVCRYMNGAVQSALLDIIVADLRKFTNLLHPCPYNVRIRRKISLSGLLADDKKLFSSRGIYMSRISLRMIHFFLLFCNLHCTGLISTRCEDTNPKLNFSDAFNCL